jgi:putative CocE/NonD family hydrolase
VHIPWGDRIGAVFLGEAAALDTDAVLLRWFNHWLKDSGEFEAEPRIRHFAMNEGRWYGAEEWPAESSRILYLHSAGRANSSKGDGALGPNGPSVAEPPDVFVYDPEVPVAGPGGLANAAGPSNQASLELGNNLLVYTGAPLDAPMHVFGSPEVELYVSTSTAAADLTAKLVCLQPNGEAMFVCVGIARSSHLFPDGYAADTPHLWRFQLEPTSWVFAAGDRLRIEIASSAYPLYDRNPGTGLAPRLADSWSWRRSTQMVFHDPVRRSAIHLPVIEPDEGGAL